ncbi:unnamed protein product [Schistosoma bovis]|nr:unnamed protein product [Schistosoma bovis]
MITRVINNNILYGHGDDHHDGDDDSHGDACDDDDGGDDDSHRDACDDDDDDDDDGDGDGGDDDGDDDGDDGDVGDDDGDDGDDVHDDGVYGIHGGCDGGGNGHEAIVIVWHFHRQHSLIYLHQCDYFHSCYSHSFNHN